MTTDELNRRFFSSTPGHGLFDMHVLIVAPFAVTDTHFETDLEIAQRHLEQGDRVTIAVCNAELPTCEANYYHDVGRCLRCIGRRIEGMERLSPRPEVIPLLRMSARLQAELRGLSVDGLTAAKLKTLYVDNFDLGWAVLSSLITALATSDFVLDDKRKDAVRLAMLSAVAVYRSIQALLEESKIDRVYVFNGRFATLRAVLRAAESKRIDCFIHERGSSIAKYALFKNHLPHDLDYYQELIREAWDQADPELRELVGASFYADRISGSPKEWYSYVVKQTRDLLPKDWREGKNNVAIFTSSTDDIDALDDVLVGSAYSNQFEAIDKILLCVRDEPRLHIYIRIHPRSHNLPDAGVKRLMELRQPGVTVIPPDSSVSTYALLRRASKVVSFGSTTGIEAAYWGIPSILALRSFFDRLGSTYNPQNHDDLMGLLLTDIGPNDRRGALMYGYFLKTFGVPFHHFSPNGLYGGVFKGLPLKPTPALRTAAWIMEQPYLRRAGTNVHLKLLKGRLLGRGS